MELFYADNTLQIGPDALDISKLLGRRIPDDDEAQIISELWGMTNKLYTATSGNPLEDFPDTFKWKPDKSFHVCPKSLVSIIFASPEIPNKIYAVESSVGWEYNPVIVPKLANLVTRSNVSPKSFEI